ncbi:MAG: CoA transferase [Deltaproteobacteria bacterium]|nr:CoA transferase [Deltaproteobacteria bacterium]
MTTSENTGLMNGHRVLDLTDEKGVLCGKILADLGADVIKVERPGGDKARRIGPFYKDLNDLEKSLFWFYTNLNKRGITLDLDTAEGRDIFKRLLPATHVIIESFEPGYMESIGLGYREIETCNPAVIMTSISPFGREGPYAHYKATDLVGCSMGGMVRIFGEPDKAPVRISLPQFFFLGSAHAAAGTAIALYHSQLTGQGQCVDVSCQEAAAKSLMDVSQRWDVGRTNIKGTGGWIITPRPEPLGDLRIRRVWKCKDGHAVLFFAGGAAPGMIASSKALVQWANEHGMGLEIRDYDWTTWDASVVTQEEADRLMKPIAEFIKTRTKAELIEAASKRSILLAPIQHAGELAQSDQLQERKFWIDVEHPLLDDTIVYPGFPMKITDIAYNAQRCAPQIGEHNNEIFLGELGLSEETLTTLRHRSVI